MTNSDLIIREFTELIKQANNTKKMGGGLKSIIIKTNVKPKYFTIACAEMYMYIGVISKIYKNIKIIQTSMLNIICKNNYSGKKKV